MAIHLGPASGRPRGNGPETAAVIEVPGRLSLNTCRVDWADRPQTIAGPLNGRLSMIHADDDRVKVQPPVPGPLPTPMLGCDVGKFTITVHSSRTGKSFTLPNTEPAIADLIAAYADHELVMEATGGYELALASAALAAGMACIRLDPRRAWAFTLG